MTVLICLAGCSSKSNKNEAAKPAAAATSKDKETKNTKSSKTTPKDARGKTTDVKPPEKKGQTNEVVITPQPPMLGKVMSVNIPGQFAVIQFSAGHVPMPEQKLSVYRGELKVGQVKISKEQMGMNVVADLVAGEIKNGDEVRPE